MALDTAGLINAIASHAASLGLFDAVNGHEPKNAPSSDLTCSVWAQDIKPVTSGLASTSVQITFSVRIYTSMLQEPADAIDPRMMDAAGALIADYVGNFTLGGILREVDVRGAEGGNGLLAEAGYLTQDGKVFRVVTISLPLILNDLWTESP